MSCIVRILNYLNDTFRKITNGRSRMRKYERKDSFIFIVDIVLIIVSTFFQNKDNEYLLHKAMSILQNDVSSAHVRKSD